MKKIYGLINSDTSKILAISKSSGRGDESRPRYKGLKPNLIEVELVEDDDGKVTYDGDIDALVKGHNWKKVKVARREESHQSITLDNIEFSLDAESFEVMKDLLLVLEDGDTAKWKVEDGTVQAITKEQILEVVKSFIERRQDGYEASWEVEEELAAGKSYAEADVILKDKFKDRKDKRKGRKKPKAPEPVVEPPPAV